MTGVITVPNLVAWSVQQAMLVGAALLAIRLLRLDAPAVRYVLLRCLLVVCLLLPFVQPHIDPAPHDAATVAASVSGVAVQGAVDRGDTAGGILDLAGRQWTGFIFLLLAAGTAARLMWMGAGVVRLRRLRRAGELAPRTHDHEQLQDVIGTRAIVRYVGQLGQPVTFGFRTPVVLLPRSLRDKAPAIQRAVLAHELWHVRRRDWIWTVAEEAVRALFWFQPALWVLVSRIQSTREEVVDELSILAVGSRRQYVDALLAYADESPLFAATAFARRRHLVHRLVLISKEAVMSARRVVICSAALVGLVASTGWYAVRAFPLVQSAGASEVFSGTPGPLERRASPVTPENPVPRRTFYAPPVYSPDAVLEGASGWITVLLVLDEAGTVAESRATGFHFSIGNKFDMNVNNMGPESFDRAIGSATFRPAPGDPPVPISTYRRFLETVATEAVRAASASRYAPPAEAPIAFTVSVPFGNATAASMPPPPPPAPSAGVRSRPGIAPPPPPPAPPASGQRSSWEASEGVLRVGGNIKPPTKIRNVNPEYPPVAKASGVQGVVILEARIEPDGTVQQVRVLRSVPLLDAAAIDAVRQWEFTPTRLNGQPVPVIMTMTVNFTLQ